VIAPAMRIHLHRSLSLLLGTAVFALAITANAARIDGLSAFEPVSAENVVPAVGDETLQVRLPDGRSLTVTPWPTFLPQRFGKQSVTGTRQMHPAGPIDRLTFSRAAESSPWMAIGNGARRSTRLIENWQLQRSRGRWSVTDGKSTKFLGRAGDPRKPVMINFGADRWCVYLLESTIPAAQPNIATEAEPQIGWAAIRLSRLQSRCSAQK
jgi:hypothetical protein